MAFHSYNFIRYNHNGLLVAAPVDEQRVTWSVNEFK